jgi:hypothetical protein
MVATPAQLSGRCPLEMALPFSFTPNWQVRPGAVHPQRNGPKSLAGKAWSMKSNDGRQPAMFGH